jgi:hypothetical protein
MDKEQVASLEAFTRLIVTSSNGPALPQQMPSALSFGRAIGVTTVEAGRL